MVALLLLCSVGGEREAGESINKMKPSPMCQLMLMLNRCT